MIRVEELREAKSKAHEHARLLCACQNVVWLQLVPRHPPFLAPHPPRPGDGPARSPEPVPAQQVNQTQLIEQVDNELLPLVTGEPHVNI